MTEYETKSGWSVQLTRIDGSTFLCAGIGNIPPVWVKRNRKWATAHAQDLRRHGFKAKVVEVTYTEPIPAK